MTTAATPPPTTRRVGSFFMQSGKRLPLEKGKALSIDPRGNAYSKKKKTLVRFPVEDSEFYINIWSSPSSATQKNSKFIDISQVAHALSRIDYKSDYEAAEKAIGGNIWSMKVLEMNNEPELSPTHSEQDLSHLVSSKSLSAHRVLSQDSKCSHEPSSGYKTLERLLSAHGSQHASTLAVPPPSKHDDARFIFSAVLSQVDLRDLWSSKFLLGLHEPVRHALFVIDRFLERAQSKDKAAADWNTSVFFTWFRDCFCEYIQAQQRIKANVLRPLVQIKYAAKREIAECYEEITFMTNAIMTQEEVFPIDATSALQSWHHRLQTLQEDIRKLNVVLYHVLNLEERSLQPALISTFNEETFHKFVMPRVYSAARPKKLVIPWIIERSKVWGDDNDVSMFKRQLSFSSRFMYDRVWYPHFARHVVAAMKALDTSLTEMPGDASGDSWFGCVIQ